MAIMFMSIISVATSLYTIKKVSRSSQAVLAQDLYLYVPSGQNVQSNPESLQFQSQDVFKSCRMKFWTLLSGEILLLCDANVIHLSVFFFCFFGVFFDDDDVA